MVSLSFSQSSPSPAPLIGHLSHHARHRMQGRGFQPAIIEAIFAYGDRRRHKGADVVFLDRAARERLRDDLGAKAFARIEHRLDAYLVIGDDDTIVTCAHRTRKLKWN